MQIQTYVVRVDKRLNGEPIHGAWRGRMWHYGETGPFIDRGEALRLVRIIGGRVVPFEESRISRIAQGLPWQETPQEDVPQEVPEPTPQETDAPADKTAFSTADLEKLLIPDGHAFPKYDKMRDEMKAAGFDYAQFYGGSPTREQMERVYYHFQTSN